MANKGTIKTGFRRTSPSYMETVAYKDGQVYLCATIFDWEIESQDIANNTSTIAWKLSVDCSTLNRYDSDAAYITVGGSTAIASTLSSSHYRGTVPQTRVEAGETKQIASGSFTVSHDSSGNRTLYSFSVITTIYGIYDEDGTSVLSISSNGASLSSTVVSLPLDAIPRHAVLLSAPEKFTDEDSPTITFAIPNGATNVRAYIAFNTSTIDIGSYAVSGSSYTFRFTDDEKRKLWSILDQGLNTKPMYFYVMSEYNGTLYHSGPILSTLEVKNYKPTLDPEVWDSNTDIVNRLTGNQYTLVKGVSNASYTTGGSARKGASIDTQVTTNGGISKHGASGVFEKVTDNVFNFVITDSRGNSTPATMEFSKTTGKFIDYVKLTCGVEVTEMTADGDVQVIIRGKFFNGSFGKKTNRLRVNYDLYKNGEEFDHVDLGYADLASNYGNSFYINGTDYTYTLNLTGLEYLSVYELKIRVSDEVAVEGVPIETVLASTPIFDWGRQDFNFNVPVTMQSDLTVNGTVKLGSTNLVYIQQQGTSSGWNYRLWSDGTAECWRTLSVTAAVSTSTNASWYSSGELSATNLTYPFTFTARPAVTVQAMPTGSSWCIVFPSNTTGSTTKTGSYQLNSMSSTTSRTHLLAYNVMGRWK